MDPNPGILQIGRGIGRQDLHGVRVTLLGRDTEPLPRIFVSAAKLREMPKPDCVSNACQSGDQLESLVVRLLLGPSQRSLRVPQGRGTRQVVFSRGACSLLASIGLGPLWFHAGQEPS